MDLARQRQLLAFLLARDRDGSLLDAGKCMWQQ